MILRYELSPKILEKKWASVTKIAAVFAEK
jgi:hypothetical protein